MQRSGLLIGGIVLALSGCVASKPRPPVEFQSEPWTFAQVPGFKLTSAHYVVHTTLRDPVLREALPGFVEAAYENYTRLVPPARTPPERMQVFLFAGRHQWEAFTRRFTGPRAATFLQVRNGGYSERGVSVIQYVSHEVTFPLFAHEGFHQYLFKCVPTPVPPWVHEGLAVCCEGQRWDDHGIREFDPWYNPSRRNELAAALIGDYLHPLRRLLETDAGHIISGSNRSVGAYYGQVWALVLFLREGEGGKYAAGFQRLLASLSAADAEQSARAAHIWSDQRDFNYGRDLFCNFISADLETVEREYVAFMRARFLGPG